MFKGLRFQMPIEGTVGSSGQRGAARMWSGRCVDTEAIAYAHARSAIASERVFARPQTLPMQRYFSNSLESHSRTSVYSVPH